MKEVFIVDGVRTAIGSFGGGLADLSSVELGKIVTKALLERAKAPAAEIDEVLFGSIYQAGLGQGVARQIAIGSGIPAEKTAVTLNMLCGSGMRTVAMAAQQILCGDAEMVVAGGTESMTNAPYLLKKARGGYKMGHGELTDSMIGDGLWDIFNNYHMGMTAENLVARYGLTREEQDKFAAESQNKAEKALKENRFADEIAPVMIPQRKGDPIAFARDEYPKAGVTPESLAKLRPAFKKDGSVTAGNASGINDGAAAAILMSKEKAKQLGVKPIMRLVNICGEGCDPKLMGIGPAYAIPKCLKQAGLKFEDIEYWEINEAFAAQWLGVGRLLKKDYGMELSLDKVNHNGSGIALGHPVGCTGLRIIVSLYYELERCGLNLGGASLCVGGGPAMASIWTRDI
ncbi:MAG TPA: acetyl-CoA C-acetyltransferase [Verrucomicrobia bacterium]|nr:acetyl-CoA C-acetyltransferase [Verrucomicrobiota bacterium]